MQVYSLNLHNVREKSVQSALPVYPLYSMAVIGLIPLTVILNNVKSPQVRLSQITWVRVHVRFGARKNG